MARYIDPERGQFEAFKALPRDEPINMLNLVRLVETATYPDGSQCSGAEAYQRYGKASGPVFSEVGGSIVWRATPQNVLIGPDDEHWDIMFVAHYPTAGAFLQMVTDPVYREAVVHRQVAVETSRLIRLGDRHDAKEFG